MGREEDEARPVGRGTAGPVLPRPLDKFSLLPIPPRCSGNTVTGVGDAGEEWERGV